MSDKRVAKIYAGADSDYTRKIFFVLKNLLGKNMYVRYHQQDVAMLNYLGESEYYGLNTEVEGTKILSKKVQENIQILETAAFEYVGAYMDYAQKLTLLKAIYDSKQLSEEDYQERVLTTQPDPNAKYEFAFTGAGLREVVFDVLKYPIVARTAKGVPQLDKYARKKLLRQKRKDDCTARKLKRSILAAGCSYEEYERLRNGDDGEKKKAKSMVLVDADEFNGKQYPFLLIMDAHASYTKEYTAYYKPMEENNLMGKLFKSYSMARIETRRIMNPLQTIKKDLKALVIPYSNDYYFLDFDMSQVEYRIMASIANATEIIMKMNHPEKDYHIETASMVEGIAPYKVTKEQRKAAKVVGFGQPYGKGEYTLTEDLEGEVTDEGLFRTRMKIQKWRGVNQPIVNLLEEARAQALTPVELSLEKRNFMDAWQRDSETKEYLLDENGAKIPKVIGAVYNKMGFCRYFDISHIDQSPQAKARRVSGSFTKEEGVIRRAAGNYPIQSYAAELFRIILLRFKKECEKEGISDKIIWHMLIHDELLCSVHKSVNPFLIYKIVKKACMITIKGHTKYFVGINIGNSWKECKDDAREAPILFVDRMIKRYEAGEFQEKHWFDNPWDLIRPLREEYVSERIHEVLRTVQPDLDSAPIDLIRIFEKFDNYTVRAYIWDYPMNGEIPKGLSKEEEEDAKYVASFESWVLEVFGEGKEIIGLDGKKYKVRKNDSIKNIVLKTEPFEDDFVDDEDVDYYDYDEGAIVSTYFSELEDNYNEEPDMQFDYSKRNNASNIAQMMFVGPKYQRLKELGTKIVITVDNEVQMYFLKSRIPRSRSGARNIMFKIGNQSPIMSDKCPDDLNLQKLDEEVLSICNLPKESMVIGDRM